MRFSALMVLVSVLVPTEAVAGWRKLKAHLKPSTTIVSESDDKLVLSAPGLGRHIVVRNADEENCDIYRTTVFRRGGNPFQVWRATASFVRDPKVPRRQWGEVFRTTFLRILRIPAGPS